jgi:hypothetical protein
MMSKQQHQEYVRAITQAVQEINPHSSNQGRIGYVYASGFLASYLASLMTEDPWAYKKFIKHCDTVKNKK